MPAIIALLSEVLSLAPSLISAGMDIKVLIDRAYDVIEENGTPGDAQWDALEQQITLLKQGALNDTSRDL